MGDESEDINCLATPLATKITSNYFLAPVSACCMCFIVWVLVKFVKTWKKPDKQKPCVSKTLFGTGSGFLTIIVLFFLTNTVTYALHCSDQYSDLYGAFNIVNLLFFVLDFAAIMLLFYLRLYYVFTDSAYALSKRTNRIFWVSYVGTLCCGFLAVGVISAVGLESPAVMLFGALFLLSYLCILVGLIMLFLRKLYKVYQASSRLGNEADAGLNKLITRTSMLATMSLSLSFITFIAVMISISFADSFGFWICAQIMVATDKFTNAVCIAYTYDGFTDIYALCCGSCHGVWARCWIRCTRDDLSVPHELQRAASGDDAVHKVVGAGHAEAASRTDGDTELTASPSQTGQTKTQTV